MPTTIFALRHQLVRGAMLGVAVTLGLASNPSSLSAAFQESEGGPAEDIQPASTPVPPETPVPLETQQTSSGDKQDDQAAEVENSVDMELIVPPQNITPLYEKERPEWLFKAPTIEDGKLILFVGGELCITAAECEKRQPAALYAEVSQYFDQEVFHESGATSRTPLNETFISTRWVNPQENYLAKVQTAEGTMYQLWSIVRIDDDGINTMKKWHLTTIQPIRIRSLGLGLLGVLSAIGLIHLGARYTANRTQKRTT